MHQDCRDGDWRTSEASTKILDPPNSGGKRIKGKAEAVDTPEVSATTSAKDAPSYLKTYRAQGIPATHNHISTKKLLQSALGLEAESSQTEVHSLALNPYDPREKTATFTYGGSFKQLPGSIKRWKFLIPEDEHSKINVPSRKLQISIDGDFEGFTPLNSFETDEDYKVE